MSILKELQSLNDLADVARLLNYRAQAISYIIYKQDPKYNCFDIPKKLSGVRTIHAPTPKLKSLQRKLTLILYRCVDEINSNNKNKASHGFEKERSIISNAQVHRNKAYVLNVDIKDFFGAINFGRIRGFFMKDRNFQLTSKVATILAQIACHDDALPQGSPCSPVISNLIGRILDVKLIRLASKFGCNYSRYADDLTFSTNKASFPKEIAYRNNGHTWEIGNGLASAISKSGFELNPLKTRMQYQDSRQEVTGLIVNKKINPRSEYMRMARAMVHSYTTKGSFIINREKGNVSQLTGMLNFIHHIQKKTENETAGFAKTFKSFLMFKHFCDLQKPTILCEGKTDYIYLKYALRSLRLSNAQDKLPEIAFFKYTETSTGKFLKLEGGTGDLLNFIKDYATSVKNFKCPEHPVILVLDNDDGAKAILNTIKNVSKKHKNMERSALKKEKFIHITHNLYVVLTQTDEDKQSKIEDFFHPRVLQTEINGKKFTSENDYDKKIHYGKNTFAREVIEKKREDIDFSGFQPLFKRIGEIEENYKQLQKND